MGAAKRDMMRRDELGYSLGPDTHVCMTCIEDSALGEIVEANLASDTCDYCGRMNKQKLIAAPLNDVIEHIAVCINRDYTIPENELPHDSAEGGFQGTVMTGSELFDDIGFSVENEELQDDISSSFNGQLWCEENYFGLKRPERQRYGWDGFKNIVKHVRRFTFWSVHDAQEDEPESIPAGQILREIGKAILEARLIRHMEVGQSYFRARVHVPTENLTGDTDLCPPPAEKAFQPNRMSPSGIVMFYGAEDFTTACVETVEAKDRTDGKAVTVGVFQTPRPLDLLDLAELPEMPSYFDLEKREARLALMFLYQFRRDLAQPIVRDGHEHIDYVPTQVFTEFIRYQFRTDQGGPVHGIRFPSAKNGKPNVVLFCGQAECIEDPDDHRVSRWLKLDPSKTKTEIAAKLPIEWDK